MFDPNSVIPKAIRSSRTTLL